MPVRVTLKLAMSLNGMIDDGGAERLVLSEPMDMQACRQLRQAYDAILVGAECIRRDDCRLVAETMDGRAVKKVCLTASGNLDSDAAFFATGSGEKLVYCPLHLAPGLRATLVGRATVGGLPGRRVELTDMLADLERRGCRSLLVEGGSQVHAQFVASKLVHALRLALSPCLVAPEGAVRAFGEHPLLTRLNGQMRLAHVEALQNMAILNYDVGHAT